MNMCTKYIPNDNRDICPAIVICLLGSCMINSKIAKAIIATGNDKYHSAE